MDQLKQAAPHLIMAFAAVAAVTILAVQRVISGGEALGIIGAVTGVSLGGAIGSSSSSTTTSTVTTAPPVGSALVPVSTAVTPVATAVSAPQSNATPTAVASDPPATV